MGLIADEHPAIYRTIEAAGLTHGKGMQSYLCMMAVRLLEMRRRVKGHGKASTFTATRLLTTISSF